MSVGWRDVIITRSSNNFSFRKSILLANPVVTFQLEKMQQLEKMWLYEELWGSNCSLYRGNKSSWRFHSWEIKPTLFENNKRLQFSLCLSIISVIRHEKLLVLFIFIFSFCIQWNLLDLHKYLIHFLLPETYRYMSFYSSFFVSFLFVWFCLNLLHQPFVDFLHLLIDLQSFGISFQFLCNLLQIYLLRGVYRVPVQTFRFWKQLQEFSSSFSEEIKVWKPSFNLPNKIFLFQFQAIEKVFWKSKISQFSEPKVNFHPIECY